MIKANVNNGEVNAELEGTKTEIFVFQYLSNWRKQPEFQNRFMNWFSYNPLKLNISRNRSIVSGLRELPHPD